MSVYLPPDELDTPPENAFDAITRLVASPFEMPIAAVTLIGARVDPRFAENPLVTDPPPCFIQTHGRRKK